MQVEQPIKAVYLDGAYDAQTFFDNLIEREINPVIPPQKGAVEWYWEEPDDHPDYPRNKAVRRINEIGRAEWKKESRYHRRSLSETAMFRFKVTYGGSHYSRKVENQKQENKLKIKALNIMTAQGMPDSKIKKKTA